jgi:hypothetical protein
MSQVTDPGRDIAYQGKSARRAACDPKQLAPMPDNPAGSTLALLPCSVRYRRIVRA